MKPNCSQIKLDDFVYPKNNQAVDVIPIVVECTECVTGDKYYSTKASYLILKSLGRSNKLNSNSSNEILQYVLCFDQRGVFYPSYMYLRTPFPKGP